MSFSNDDPINIEQSLFIEIQQYRIRCAILKFQHFFIPTNYKHESVKLKYYLQIWDFERKSSFKNILYRKIRDSSKWKNI